MTRIQKLTATVYKGANNRRYLTKHGAAFSLAKKKYRDEHQATECTCKHDMRRCLHCIEEDRAEFIIAEYARDILRRPVEEARG